MKPAELEEEARMYVNLYKWRYTNLLPINFRHEIMIDETLLMKEYLKKYID